MTDEVIFRDFTQKRSPIAFGLDGQRFYCVKALSADALQDLMRPLRGGKLQAALKDESVDDVMDIIRDMFEIFLLDDSFPSFLEKLRDKNDPVDVNQIVEIVSWVVERYAARPTQPSPSSSDGSPSGDGGTSSTAGAQLAESIRLNEISASSST